MEWLLGVMRATSGWKRIIGYIALHVPFLGGNPILIDAIVKVIENPSDMAALQNLVINVILAVGMVDGVRKNLQTRQAS